MKSKLITFFLGMVFLLAGGGLLAGYNLGSELLGLAFMFLCALCFIIVATWSKKNWWAIIPAGIFASLGLVAVLEILIPHEEYPSLPNTLSWGVYTWVLFLALAVTFGAVWLHRKTEPTGWAKYPAAGLLVISLLALVTREHFQVLWLASMVLLVGAMLLLDKIFEKRPAAALKVPVAKS